MDANVERPKHPMHALTTFELRDYRRQLEAAIAFFEVVSSANRRTGLSESPQRVRLRLALPLSLGQDWTR